MKPKYVFQKVLPYMAAGGILAGGVTRTPQGVSHFPTIEVVSETQAKELDRINKGRQARVQNAIVEASTNVFKGGPRKAPTPRSALAFADSAGFIFIELASCIEAVKSVCDSIFQNYVSFVTVAPWQEYAVVHQLTQAIRQGETTQDAQARVVEESKQCCKAVSGASVAILSEMQSVLATYTYKTADNVPRFSRKKRTRL